MPPIRTICALGLSLLLGACSTGPTRPAAWAAPEPLVAPSYFTGVHGLAVDTQGRLLAGTVVGNSLWVVDRNTGQARVLIGAPEGQADDIAIGPKGEMAWTSYLQGIVRYRENDNAPIRVLAKDLPGINSLAFDLKSGKLYASQVFLGDAMWEIDVAGAKPPRLIAKDMGGFNGFEVGPDGMIVRAFVVQGTAWRRWTRPAAPSLSSTASSRRRPQPTWTARATCGSSTRRLASSSRVDLVNGRRTVVKKLATALDNLAIAPDGTIYVSNMADNAVQSFDPATGELRTLTAGKLAVPAGMKVEGDTLWVADIFAFREVDLKSGAVRDIHRMQASDMEYPFAVGVNARQLLLTSWFTGSVQVLDRSGWKTTTMIHGLNAPMDAQFLADGSIAIAEIATGSITIASGAGFKERRTLATGLAGPVQMVVGPDGALYVTEAAGNLLRIDAASGAKTLVADKLLLPEGLAFTPWGSIIVAESAARRLTEINPADGSRRSVAENLPIGLEAGPGLPPPYVVTGVAVASDGSTYFSADRNNAIYRVRPQRP